MPSQWRQNAYVDALNYAAAAHAGQAMPDGDLPYLVHPVTVAMEVIAALSHEDGLNGDLTVQCALLHDVIEDSDTTVDQLAAVFGADVARGVQALSRDDALPGRTAQIADSLSRIVRQPREIWIVKLADRIANLQPPPRHWTAAKIAAYRDEAILIRNALGEASRFLAKRLGQRIEAYPGRALS